MRFKEWFRQEFGREYDSTIQLDHAASRAYYAGAASLQGASQPKLYALSMSIIDETRIDEKYYYNFDKMIWTQEPTMECFAELNIVEKFQEAFKLLGHSAKVCGK